MRLTLPLLLALLAGSLLATTSPPEGGWLADPLTGTRVWSHRDTSGQAVSWSGDALDTKAHGFGVLTWLSEGKIVGRYEGEMQAGRATGVGTLLILRDEGMLRYTGHFADNQAHGTGVAYLPDGTIVHGEFAHDQMEGRVRIIRSDGSSYLGHVVANRPHGRGLQVQANGERYLGDFVHGERHGQGHLDYAHGDYYEGEFAHGLPAGHGTLHTAEGGSFTGPFVDGKPHGEGEITTPAGETTHGTLLAGVPQGEFILTAADGSTRTLVWENGERREL